MRDAEHRDDAEPENEDGAEDLPHAGRSLALNREQQRKNNKSDRHDGVREHRRRDFQAFNGGEHADCWRNDAIPEQKPCAQHEPRKQQREIAAPLLVFVQQAVKREDAAFAVAIGAQNKSRVFAAYNERQRPKDEGDAAEDVVRRERDVRRAIENLIDGVERRGADIAKDHTDCADSQCRLERCAAYG